MNHKTLKNKNMKIFLVSIVLFITALTGSLVAGTETEGTLTFTVRTVTAGGNFSPRHVLAIWIEDDNGFVLTRLRNADKRRQYLYTWNTESAGNVTDATTGATLTSHQTHTVSWDCMGLDGNLVPDGNYKVFVEFTEEHAQGPLRMVPFIKGAEPVSLTPDDDANFKDLVLEFQPATSTAMANHSLGSPQIYPNPTEGIVTVEPAGAAEISSIKVFSVNGALIRSMSSAGKGAIQLNLSDLETGSYILQVESNQKSYRQKIVRE